jgi:hypothetical protein
MSIILKTFLLLILLCSTGYAALSQDIQSINLKIGTSMPLEGTSYNIGIFRGIDRIGSIKLKVESLELNLGKPKEPIVKEMSITVEQFDAIVNSIMNIKQADIVGGPHPNFLHSVPVSISAGKMGNFISYNVASPYYHSKERNLTDFLTCYELIMKAAMLDSERLPK